MSEDCREKMFCLLCLPARLALATVVTVLEDDLFPYNIILCYTIAFVLLLKFLMQECSDRQVYLGGFGGEVYWHNARLIHAVVYSSAATLLLYKPWGGVILYIDVLVAIYVHSTK